MFYVGQKVVCVDDKSHPGASWGSTETPKCGDIYTVSGVLLSNDDVLVLHLIEIQRDRESRAIFGPDVGFGAYRFRPLINTDISMFEAMLNPQRETERV